MSRTLLLLLAVTGLVACEQQPQSAQQQAAIEQFRAAEEHIDRANSGTRPQPVKVTKTLEEYQSLYVGDRDQQEGPEGQYYAKTKARMQADSRPDVMELNDIRQPELDKSISHLTSMATDEAGRPAQKLAAELALGEQMASKAIFRATRASNRWADHTHLVSRSTEDSAQIRLLSAKAAVLTDAKFAKGREAVNQEKQKANARLEQVNSTIGQEQSKIDELNNNIATWSKQRDETYLAADKSSRAAFTKTGQEKADLELAAVKARDKARELELKIDKAKTDLELATAAKEVADASKASLEETLRRIDEADAAIDQRIIKNSAIIAHCYEAIKLSLDGFGGEKAPGKGFDKNVKTLIDLMKGEVAEAFTQADKDFAQALTHMERARNLAKDNASKNIVALQLASTHANRAHALHRKTLAYQGFERMLKFIDENLTASEADKRVDAAAAATAAAAQMREAAGKAQDAQIKSRVESGASLAEDAGPRISTVHEQVKAALTEVTAMIEADKTAAEEQFGKATEAANIAATHKDARVKLAANKQLAHVMIGNGRLTGNAEDVNRGITMLKSSEAQEAAAEPTPPAPKPAEPKPAEPTK